MVHHELVLQPGDKLTVEVAPAAPVLERQDAITQGGSKKNRKSTTRKNQAGGKRGPNGYMRFAAKMRKQIQEANPGADVVTVAKKTGEAWRKLSDSEKASY